MRLLIDECLPVNLKKHFVGHDCRTLKEMGWLGKKNGELLSLAENQFDFLVTIDQGIPHQQSLSGSGMRLLLFEAPTNSLEDLLPLIPKALEALSSATTSTRVLRVASQSS